MPGSILKNRLRIQVDNVLSRGAMLIDQLTARPEVLWQSEDCQVELGIFSNGTIVSDLSNFASVTFEVRDPENLLAAPLINKTVASPGVITLANWNNGSAQNALFALSSASDTNIPLVGSFQKTLNFYFYATTTDPFRLPLGWGQVLLTDSGFGDIGSQTVLPPGARMKSNALQVQCVEDSLYYNVRIHKVAGTFALSIDGNGDP